MAFISTVDLNHGLGAVNFGGVYKLRNGKFILFVKFGGDIYEMANEVTPAVLIYTGATLFEAGAAGVQQDDGRDRVVLTDGWTFVLVQYDAFGVATVEPPQNFTWFGTSLLVQIAFGSIGVPTTRHNFYVLAEDFNAAVITPLTPTGFTLSTWTVGKDALTTLSELPGIPAFVNSWPQVAALSEYDATDVAVFTAAAPWQTLDISFLPLVNNTAVRAYHKGRPAGTQIAGGSDGRVFTTAGGHVNPAFGEGIAAVFYSALNTTYLVLLETSVKRSAGGVTWLGTTGISVPSIAIPAQANFAELVTRDFLVFNLQANPVLAPNTRWWRSSNAIAWTLMATELNMVFGFYSNSGAGGPNVIIKLDTSNGDIHYSTDEGTSFTGPVLGLFPAADAATIRWMQETPTGLVAWGYDGPIFSQVAADLFSVAWINQGWSNALIGGPGGHLGAHLKVTDSGTIQVHRKYQGTAGTPHQHYETWTKAVAGNWTKKLAPRYAGLAPLAATSAIGFLSVGTGGVAPDPATQQGSDYALVVGQIAPALVSASTVVGYFSGPTVLTAFASWVQDMDPELSIATQGPRRLFVLAYFTNFKYARLNEPVLQADRQVGWFDAADLLRDENGAVVAGISSLSCDLDVLCAISGFGSVSVSADGSTWDWVYQSLVANLKSHVAVT